MSNISIENDLRLLFWITQNDPCKSSPEQYWPKSLAYYTVIKGHWNMLDSFQVICFLSRKFELEASPSAYFDILSIQCVHQLLTSMFLFFQAEICSSSLTEIIQAVVNGADGCLFCYGHARLGKCFVAIFYLYWYSFFVTYGCIYKQTSNIGCTKSQNLKNVSHLILQLSLPNLLKPAVRLRMKM